MGRTLWTVWTWAARFTRVHFGCLVHDDQRNALFQLEVRTFARNHRLASFFLNFDVGVRIVDADTANRILVQTRLFAQHRQQPARFRTFVATDRELEPNRRPKFLFLLLAINRHATQFFRRAATFLIEAQIGSSDLFSAVFF